MLADKKKSCQLGYGPVRWINAVWQAGKKTALTTDEI
jgi:hypothetical protein